MEDQWEHRTWIRGSGANYKPDLVSKTKCDRCHVDFGTVNNIARVTGENFDQFCDSADPMADQVRIRRGNRGGPTHPEDKVGRPGRGAGRKTGWRWRAYASGGSGGRRTYNTCP